MISVFSSPGCCIISSDCSLVIAQEMLAVRADLPTDIGSYLGLYISIVIILKQEGGRLGVIFPSRNVQSRQPHLSFGVILQEYGHRLVVSLLECHSQRSKAVLEYNVRE